MTDGAGKINRWSLNQIRHLLNWEDKPTAIQTRIFGTKVHLTVMLRMYIVLLIFLDFAPGASGGRRYKRRKLCVCGGYSFTA